MTSKTPSSRIDTPTFHLRTLLSGLLLVALVVGGSGYWLHQQLIIAEQQQNLADLSAERAADQAQSVRIYIGQLRKELQTLARSGLALEALGGDPDPEAQARVAADLPELTGQFPEAIAIRLVHRAQDIERDPSGPAPIGFAELSMMQRAMRAQTVLPEAAKVDDGWVIHAVSAVRASDESPILGALFISLPPAGLATSIGGLDANAGRTQVQQQFPTAAAQTIVTHGNAAGLGDTVFEDLPNSPWRIAFAPGPALVAAAQVSGLWLWLSLAGAAILGVGATLFAARWMGHKEAVRLEARAAFEQMRASGDKAAAAAGKDDYVDPIYQKNRDILDIDIVDEDKDLLGLKASGDSQDAAAAPNKGLTVPDEIFRAYDIRGLVDAQLTDELAELIGRAIASEALDQGQDTIAVGADGRTHSPRFKEQLLAGLTGAGIQVIDVGTVPTPVLYFATHHLAETQSGVMITASHNPAEYNGFKMVINGKTQAEDDIQNLKQRIIDQRFHTGVGDVEQRDVTDAYIDTIVGDIALMDMHKVVVDAGNGVGGAIAPRLFEELGCEVVPLYCEVDGTFPNHEADPTKEKNLQDLIQAVKDEQADLGIALDGDADRVGVVTPKGEIIWPDRLLMLFAKDIVSRNPGADILYDVKCTRALSQVITSYGGRPVMWKTGHSHMKQKLAASGALLAGEFSGHIFFKERWFGFDDGLYAACRLLEIMSLREQDLDTIFEAFPMLESTPELKIEVPEAEKFAIIERLAKQDFQGGKLTTLDGVRVDFAKGWGLVRASNTTPALTVRFEGDNAQVIEQLQGLFKQALKKAAPDLALPF